MLVIEGAEVFNSVLQGFQTRYFHNNTATTRILVFTLHCNYETLKDTNVPFESLKQGCLFFQISSIYPTYKLFPRNTNISTNSNLSFFLFILQCDKGYTISLTKKFQSTNW